MVHPLRTNLVSVCNAGYFPSAASCPQPCRGTHRLCRRAKRPPTCGCPGLVRARHGLQFFQHRHRPIIGINALRGQDVSPQGLNSRAQHHHAGADPVGKRRDVKLDARARIGNLSVDRMQVQSLAQAFKYGISAAMVRFYGRYLRQQTA
jgi:hypothetical protein